MPKMTNFEQILFEYLTAAILSNGGELKITNRALREAGLLNYKLMLDENHLDGTKVFKIHSSEEKELITNGEDDSYERMLLKHEQGDTSIR